MIGLADDDRIRPSQLTELMVRKICGRGIKASVFRKKCFNEGVNLVGSTVDVAKQHADSVFSASNTASWSIFSSVNNAHMTKQQQYK